MEYAPPQELWPSQRLALEQLYPNLDPGSAHCVTSPCGGGKTEIQFELLKLGLPSVLYTHRKMLLDQTAERLRYTGLPFGIRAAGYPDDRDQPIQLASIQTDDSRSMKRNKWALHQAQLVLVDEAHTVKGEQATRILREYRERGAAVVGFTATPLDIGHIYDDLIVAGTNSDLRDQGAIIPAKHFAPDEPDTRHVKRVKTGEYKYGDVTKIIMTHSIFGRVLDHWLKHNPEQRPTILFAPGVKESLWFAEQLTAKGIVSAHIDGDNVWLMGKMYKSDKEARDAVRTMSESGDIKIVCNRFVMREGISWNHLYCGIFATMFGALTSYIQSGGRLLRAHPDMDHVVVIDHGGNWHRHGSLNDNRQWDLNVTDYMVCETREAALRNKDLPEPIVCPVCHYIRLSGSKCMNCGHEHTTKARIVVQHDGSLKEVTGDIYKPRRHDRRPGLQERMERYYHRFRKTDRTFNQLTALYAYENYWAYPPENAPYLPLDPLDFFRKVKDVPREKLVQPVK
jgi:superfamily II DNA or RNA helicase